MTPPKSDRWLEAFAKQATSALIARCRLYAARRLRLLRLARDSQHPHELVQNALADVFAGSIEWNPDTDTLLEFVCEVLRYRVRDEWRSGGGRPRHLTIYEGGAVEAEMAKTLPQQEDPERHLARKQASAMGERVGDELAALAHKDADVTALLTCLREGISKRRAVLAETGLSPEAYRQALRRLHRLEQRLPKELRLQAMALVRLETEPER